MTRRTFPALVALTIFSFGFAPGDQAPVERTQKPAPVEKGATAPKAGATKKDVVEAPPDVGEIRKLLDEGKAREALQKLSRALALKGKAASVYDRYDLLRLKAEAHLRLKDASAATSAFAAAAKETEDEVARAECKASEIVIKRSKNLQFTPKADKKNQKPQPIDIADPEKRKEAFASLLAEEKAEAAPKLKAARDAKTLPPIIEALKLIGDMRMLELAATGADGGADDSSKSLTDQALKLMSDAVKDMADLVADVEVAANDLQEISVPARGPNGTATLDRTYRRRGLMTQDTRDLKSTIADLKKLVPLARELAKSLGDEGKPFEKLAEDGAAVGNKAHEVLTTDYSNDAGTMRRETRLKRPVERR